MLEQHPGSAVSELRQRPEAAFEKVEQATRRQSVSKRIWLGCLMAATIIGCGGRCPRATAPRRQAGGGRIGSGGPGSRLRAARLQALVDKTPKGELKNPYKDTDAAVVTAGQRRVLSARAATAATVANGGGGMCPPLINDTWVYGGDDDTLFRLVTLGSDALQAKGYTRTGMEHVVGPMPPMGAIVPTADDLWKIIPSSAPITTVRRSCKFGCPVDAPPPPGS